MRALVTDDEKPARDELIYLLSKIEDVEIIGIAADGAETLQKVKELHPDVLFLDIEMPDASGVEIAREIASENSDIAVVFATAYDKYALKAFDVNAVDYLLKPFNEKRLAETIERLRKRYHPQGNQFNNGKNESVPDDFLEKIESIYTMLNPNAKIKVEENEKIYLIPVQDVIYACIEERLVRIVTAKKGFLCHYSLNQLEKMLGNQFLRVHKSFLANLNKVESITPWFNNTFNLMMQDGSKIPVSRNYAKSFRKRLGL
jgi:two-component system response regulator LytT